MAITCFVFRWNNETPSAIELVRKLLRYDTLLVETTETDTKSVRSRIDERLDFFERGLGRSLPRPEVVRAACSRTEWNEPEPEPRNALDEKLERLEKRYEKDAEQRRSNPSVERGIGFRERMKNLFSDSIPPGGERFVLNATGRDGGFIDIVTEIRSRQSAVRPFGRESANAAGFVLRMNVPSLLRIQEAENVSKAVDEALRSGSLLVLSNGSPVDRRALENIIVFMEKWAESRSCRQNELP